MTPDAPELRAVLGDASARTSTSTPAPNPRAPSITSALEQSFSVRVRCRNAAGASRWVGTHVTTCQVPVNCGGTGPDGTTSGTRPRPTSRFASRRLPGSSRGASPSPSNPEDWKCVSMAPPPPGALTAEVLCQRSATSSGVRDVPGDGEGDGAREVFITLEKRVADCVKYDLMGARGSALGRGGPRADRPDAAAVVPGRGVAPAAGRAQPRGGGQGAPRDEDVGSGSDQSGRTGTGVLDDWGRDGVNPTRRRPAPDGDETRVFLNALS